jgi:hypothetical protein
MSDPLCSNRERCIGSIGKKLAGKKRMVGWVSETSALLI